MYKLKKDICERLLQQSRTGFPSRKVIEKYMYEGRQAQENSVRLFAFHLGEANWKDLVEIK